MDIVEFIDNFYKEQSIESMIMIMLHNHWDVNSSNSNGRSMLACCCNNTNRMSIINLLIDNNADINQTDRHGSTPLNIASEYSNLDIVKKLLNHKADPNINDNDGDSPLICSMWKNNMEISKLLIDHKANINLTNNILKSPLDYALENGLTTFQINQLFGIDFEIENLLLNENKKCPICYQEINLNIYMQCKNCNYNFCKFCLTEWFKTQMEYDKKCPHCKCKWQNNKLYINGID